MRKIIIFLFCLLSMSLCFGQKKFLIDEIITASSNDLRFSVGHHFATSEGSATWLSNNSATIEIHHDLAKRWGLGAYLGAHPCYAVSADASRDRLAFSFGLATSFHALPFFVLDAPHWDPYIIGKAGGCYVSTLYLEYAVGLGIGYYFNRHFGLFLEGGYGNTALCEDAEQNRTQPHLQCRIGLSFKL